MRRRGLVLLTVMVIVVMSALIGTTLILSTDAERSLIEGRLAIEQSRSMAWSGVEAAVSELAGQRTDLLAGGDPELTASWSAIDGGTFGRGVVRLVAFESGELARSEAGGLDLNAATADMLARLPGLSPDAAEAIVSGRSAGAWTGVEELARLDETRALLGVSGESSTAFDGVGPVGSAGGVRGWLTAFAFDPEVRSGADAAFAPIGGGDASEARIVLAGAWDQVTSDIVRDRLDAGTAELVIAVMSADNAPTSMSGFVRALVDRGLDRAGLGEIVDTFTFSLDPFAIGRVDINRAPLEVLSAIPGVGQEAARTLVDARERVPSESRRSSAWTVTDGDLPVEAFADACEWMTTRTTVWRVRVEAGFNDAGDGADGGFDPFDGAAEFELPDADEFGTAIEPDREQVGALRHRVVLEAVIDVSAPRPRIAYLRDVTSLEIARAQRKAFASLSDAGGLTRGPRAEDDLTIEDDAVGDDPVGDSGQATGFDSRDRLFDRSVGVDDSERTSIFDGDWFGDRSTSEPDGGDPADGDAQASVPSERRGERGGSGRGVDRRTGRWTSGGG